MTTTSMHFGCRTDLNVVSEEPLEASCQCHPSAVINKLNAAFEAKFTTKKIRELLRELGKEAATS
jgi:hypothetical protein